MVYIAANALVNAAVLTPLAMVLLAIGNNMESAPEKTESGATVAQQSKLMVVLSVLRELVLNPTIAMTIMGFVFHYVLGFTIEVDSKGEPIFISPLKELVDLLTSPFGMCALFLTGVSLETPRFQFWPVLLVVMKVVLCAWASYAFAAWFVDSPSVSDAEEERLTNFSFLYGMIPTSSAPLLFARQFDESAVELIATAILFGLVLAGPLMFGAAVVLEGVRDFPQLLVTVELQTAAVGLVCGLFLVLTLLVLRQHWGYESPFRFLIAGLIVISFLHEAVTFLMNPDVSTKPCEVYIDDAFSSHYGFVLSMLQTSFRVVVLLLTVMGLSGRVPQGSKRYGALMLAGSLLVGLVCAFFTVPHTVAEMCQQVRPTQDKEVHTSAPLANVIVDLVFMLLFVVGGGSLVICGSGKQGGTPEIEDESSSVQEKEERKDSFREGEEGDVAPPPKGWLEKWPKAVVQGLAFAQIVLVFLQLINTMEVMETSAIAGSFQMMLLFEMLLQHGLPVIMMLLLVSNMSYCMHLKAVVRGICPCFFWASTEDEEEDMWITGSVDSTASAATSASAPSSKASAVGRLDTMGMHRLVSMAETYNFPEDMRRRSIVVARRSTTAAVRALPRSTSAANRALARDTEGRDLNQMGV